MLEMLLHITSLAFLLLEVASSADGTARAASKKPNLLLIPNECASSRVNAKNRVKEQLRDSIWIPECDSENDKLYAEKQCHQSSVCWCADKSTGLPLSTSEQLTIKAGVNCSEIKKTVDFEASLMKPRGTTIMQSSFYSGSSDLCNAQKRANFVSSLSDQFRRQISEGARNPRSQTPVIFTSVDPLSLDESGISHWKFMLIDKDHDNKLSDREWSKFKNNFKLVDNIDDIESYYKHPIGQTSNMPLIILREQRKCWRDFLEFCGNGSILTNESIDLSRWLSCTEIPRGLDVGSIHATRTNPSHADSEQAAMARSKNKNPFEPLLKPY